jgi:hypothetical protein
VRQSGWRSPSEGGMGCEGGYPFAKRDPKPPEGSEARGRTTEQERSVDVSEAMARSSEQGDCSTATVRSNTPAESAPLPSWAEKAYGQYRFRTRRHALLRTTRARDRFSYDLREKVVLR